MHNQQQQQQHCQAGLVTDLVVVDEVLEELHVSQQLLGRAPEVFDLLARTRRVGNAVRLDALQRADRLQHQSHARCT